MRRNEHIEMTNDGELKTREAKEGSSDDEIDKSEKDETSDDEVANEGSTEEFVKRLMAQAEELKKMMSHKDEVRKRGHPIYHPCFVITYLTVACSLATMVVLHLKGYF